ncbi:cell division protein ZapA [Aurantimonas sp. A2-1-M11]|uniref:cell division protein ZapA n=1 Tax=Aurantimonas sp. A2-1-M11 TaxID=3113712 RepID=UPI002F9598B7
MPQVVVTIDDKTYRMACGDGEEAHLTSLAKEVDRKIAGLRGNFGQIGDLRLTVMAAIMATDELTEARRRIAELESGLAERAAQTGQSEDSFRVERSRFVETLNEAAASLERIGAHLAEG